jgi:hypothetical protein
MLDKFVEFRKQASSDEEAIVKAEELKSTVYQLKV